MKAAMAALAAGSQAKFWEFHDFLFKNYNSLNDKVINDVAVELKLNQAEWEQKMKTPEIANQIRQDIVDGQQVGVRGTPAVYINGKLLRDRSLNGFKAIIDDELKKKAGQ